MYGTSDFDNIQGFFKYFLYTLNPWKDYLYPQDFFIDFYTCLNEDLHEDSADITISDYPSIFEGTERLNHITELNLCKQVK